MVAIGSTGKIMLQIADCARKKGHIVKTGDGSLIQEINNNGFEQFIPKDCE